MNETENTIDLDEAMAHAPFLRRVARALVGDEQAVDDLLQETWVTAMDHPPQRRGRLRAWLVTVLKNKAYNRHRSSARRSQREQASARPEAVESGEAQQQLEVQRRVFEHVLSLDEPYRTAIHMRFYEGIGPSEIALRLQTPVKTVKTRLQRALTILRSQLDREHGEDRERWLSALLPLAAPPPASVAPVSYLLGSLVMKKLVVAAALLLVSGLVLGPWMLARWWPVNLSRAEESGGPAFVSVSFSAPQGASLDADLAPVEVDRVLMETPAQAAQVNAGSIVVEVAWEEGGVAADIGVFSEFHGPGLSRLQIMYARTNTDGVAHFDQIPAGSVRVRLNRSRADGEVDVIAGEESRLKLKLSAGIRVMGRVLDPEGRPANGAEIWIQSISRRWPSFHIATWADADGRFRLEGVGSQTRIGARAAGCLPSLVVEARNLPQEDPGQREVELHLFAGGGQLRGRVVDEQGQAVQAATVVAGPAGGGNTDLLPGVRAVRPYPVLIETDAEGRFVYPGNLPAGTHPVTVTACGFPAWAQSVEIVGGQASELEIQLVDGARIVGRLVDREGVPVAGGRVLIAEEIRGGWYRHQAPPPTATTDADGRFVLEGVAPGKRELNASPVRAERARGKALWQFECSSGEQLSVELVLDVGRTIEGRVVDSMGIPVPSWMVRSNGLEPIEHNGMLGNSYSRDASTDADGRFRLANLGPGVHDLDLSPGRHLGSPVAWVSAVEAGTIDLEIVVDPPNKPSASIAGFLVSLPVNAWVTLWDGDDKIGHFVDVDAGTGRFEHGPLIPGSYRLKVLQSRLSLYVGEHFELSDGEHLNLGVIQLQSPGDLSLKLVGDLPQDVHNLRISADRKGCSSVSFRFEDGHFLSDPLSEGRWLVRLRQEPYFMPDTWVDILSGEIQEIELEIGRAYERNLTCLFESDDVEWNTLSVEVRDAEGKLMLARPDLSRQRHMSSPRFGGRLTRSGKVRYPSMNLPDGKYIVHAWTDTGLEGRDEVLFSGPRMKGEDWTLELR